MLNPEYANQPIDNKRVYSLISKYSKFEYAIKQGLTKRVKTVLRDRKVKGDAMRINDVHLHTPRMVGVDLV